MKVILKSLAAASLLLATSPAFAQAGAPAAGSPAVAPATSAVDPMAVAALERMGNYLRSLKSFSVHGDSTFDLVDEDGQLLEFPATIDYQVRAPDGLTLALKTDRKERKFYYDGRQLTLYGARNHYYATVAAPPTIRGLLDSAHDKYGLDLPLADLFLWGTDRAPVSALTSASFVGPAHIDGTLTEQYAFRQDGVDWQVWIETGSKPLPRRMVITTTDDAARPQYASTLTWNTSASFTAGTFVFAPGKDDKRIELIPVATGEDGNQEGTP